MRRVQQAALPYAAAALGVAAITALIATVRPWNDPPNLAIAYVLLVLWLGARHGWPPAVAAAALPVPGYDRVFLAPLRAVLGRGAPGPGQPGRPPPAPP